MDKTYRKVRSRESDRKVKNGKALEKDKMENEVWKYRGKGLKKMVWEVCRMVWEGAKWSETWKEGLIPLRKKKMEKK